MKCSFEETIKYHLHTETMGEKLRTVVYRTQGSVAREATMQIIKRTRKKTNNRLMLSTNHNNWVSWTKQSCHMEAPETIKFQHQSTCKRIYLIVFLRHWIQISMALSIFVYVGVISIFSSSTSFKNNHTAPMCKNRVEPYSPTRLDLSLQDNWEGKRQMLPKRRPSRWDPF